MSKIPSGRPFAALAMTLALPGCCTMARLFCGPDTTPWVSVDFETPAATVATFREAARRDDAIVAYRTLSEGFKRRSGVVGSVEASIVWERLKDEVSGLHLLGYSEVRGPEPWPGGRLAYELEVSGHRVRLVLVRQPYYDFRWDDGDPNRLVDESRYITEPLDAMVDVESDLLDDTSSVTATFPPIARAGIEPEQITTAAVGHVWKIDELEAIEDEVD